MYLSSFYKQSKLPIRRLISAPLAAMFLFPTFSNAAEDTPAPLNFRENVQYAPYMYRFKGNTAKLPQGYVPALLKYFMDDHKVQLEFVDVPRNRVPSSFAQKKLDAAVLSPKWIDNPEEFVFTQPLAAYKTVIVGDANQDGAQHIDFTQLENSYICASRGYRYPELDNYWKSNNLVRVDFSDELLQLKGLVADRCQYAVMDESIASWYIKRYFKSGNLKIVGEEVSLPLTIGFRKDKAEYAALFDNTISRLKANGELKILQRVFGVVGF